MRPFSVIIPTFNNRSLKDGCLRLVLLALEVNAEVIEEVIVVENASTDGGWSEDRFRSSALHIRVIGCPQRNNRAVARNRGVQEARAPYLVFIDDDMFCLGPVLCDLAPELHEEAFWTCARRRYLPLGIDAVALEAAIRSDDFDWLVSNSNEMPGGGRALRVWQYPHLFTTLTAFSVVPRRLLERAGGFDAEYDGWGHEDTELTIRMLQLVPLKNLFNRLITFHRDHVISPYQFQEYTQTRKLFDETLRKRQQFFDPNSFAAQVTRGQDLTTSVFYGKKVELARALDLGNTESGAIVDAAIAEARPNSVVLGCLLIPGSADADPAPELDLRMLCASGEHRSFWRHYPQTASPARIELVPMQHVRRLEAWHRRFPETWMLEIGAWDRAQVLWDCDDVARGVRSHLVRWRGDRATFTLTYALGKLATLRNQVAHPPSEGWRCREAARYETMITLLLAQRYPHADSELLGTFTASIEEIWTRTSLAIVELLPCPPTGVTEIKCYHPENLIGAEALKTIAPAWSTCVTRELPD